MLQSQHLRRTGRLLSGLTNACLIGLAIGVILIGLRHDLAERAAKDAAAYAGLSPLDLKVETLRPHAIVLTGIESPANALRLARLKLDIAPAGAQGPRITAVTAQDLQARIDLDSPGSRNPLEALAPLLARRSGSAGESVAAPVTLPALRLLNADIQVTRRDARAAFRFNATIMPTQDGNANLALRGSAASAAGKLEISAGIRNLLGVPEISLEAEGPIAPAALPWPENGLIRPNAGKLDIALQAQGALTESPVEHGMSALTTAAAAMRLSFTASNVAFTDLAEGIAAKADLHAEIDGDSGIVRLAAPLTMTADKIDHEKLQNTGLSEPAANLAASLKRLRLAAWSPGGELLEIQRRGGRWQLNGRGSLQADFDDGSARLQADLRGHLDSQGARTDFTAKTLQIDMKDLSFGSHRLATAQFKGRAAWQPGKLVLPGRVEARFARVALGNHKMTDAALKGDLRLVHRNGTTAVELVEEGEARLNAPLQVGPVAIDAPLTVRMRRGRARLGSDGLDARLTLDPGTITTAIKRTDGPDLHLVLTPGSVMAKITRKADEPVIESRLRLQDATAAAPDYGIRATGIALDAAPSGAAGPAGTLTVTTLQDERPTPRFAPLALEATLRQAGGQLTAAGHIAIKDSPVQLPLAGRHDLSRESGLLRLGPTRIAFETGSLQPADISPRLAALTKTDGGLRLEGRLRWTPKGLQSPSEIVFDNLSFTTPAAQIEALDGTVTLKSLLPPITQGDQVLTARRAIALIPLTDVRARFRLAAGDKAAPVLRLRRASGALAGGRVFLRDTTLRPLATRNNLTVRVSGLSLKQLFAQLDMDGVSGEGHLSGAIPLRLENGEVSVDDGQLAAESDGALRLRLDRTGKALKQKGEQVALMLRALENFQYDSLALSLNRTAEGALSLGVKMAGKNPDVLDGYPFNFNVSFSGDLEPVFAALRKGRRLSSEMLQRALEADN